MTANERMNRALDAALEMTFPASDPIAIYTPEEPSSRASADSIPAARRETARPS